MFEPNFAFSPTPSNEDNFFDAFVEAQCMDEGAAQNFSLNNKPAPIKIPNKDAPLAANVAKLLTSPQGKQADSFLQLLDDNFGAPTDFLISPAQTVSAQQAQVEAFLPFAIEAAPIAQESVAPVAQKKKLNKKAPAAPKAAQQNAVLDPERSFKTVYVNKDIVQSGDITLKMKTRRDQASEFVPERLYNSIKYNLAQTATNFPEHLPLIIARIRAVDAETLEVVKKNGKDVLKGTVETALTKPTQGSAHQFEGQLYVQFTEVSYHVDKREYCFEVAYFIREDLENPIMIKRSAPFKTFARKPNKKRPKKGEQKKQADSAQEDEMDENNDSEDEELEQPMAKKQKNTQNYDAFVAKAEELFEFNKKLGDEERKKAMALVIQKFYQIDPVYTTTVLLPTAANSFLSFAPQQPGSRMKF